MDLNFNDLIDILDGEEFEEQQSRLKWGLVPDPMDIGNYKDEVKKYGNLRG